VLCSLSDIKVMTKPVKPELYTVTVRNACAYCSASWVTVESSHPGYPTLIKGWGGTLKPNEVFTTVPIYGNPSLPHPATQVNYTCIV
jgi:transcriptional regulator NrdR family protein